jgi:asparagine synthase (glutamine-hydrolysing)
MKFVTCMIDRSGDLLSEGRRRPYECLARRLGLTTTWAVTQNVAVLTVGGDHATATSISEDGSVAVGQVRLDNAAEVGRWLGGRTPEVDDLRLVQALVMEHGTRYLPHLLGDFAFVVWNGHTHTGIAACDAFAVRSLFYAHRGPLVVFSTRAEALVLDERYDEQYLAERVAHCLPSGGRTVYEGIKAVAGGHMAIVGSRTFTTHQYWSAYEVEATGCGSSEGAAVEMCRELLAESVRLRLGPPSQKGVWSHLSGGMDSSSIVSVAQWLVARGEVHCGLQGTVTWADTHGTGADEREYAQAVLSRWQVPNRVVMDAPIWHDESYPIPRLDGPSMALVQYPREARVAELLTQGGAKVLLTGTAGDILFSGNMFFFADWLVGGRAREALREMGRRAAIGRVSFWELGYRNALLPLLPPRLQRRLVRDDGELPPWLARGMVRRHQLGHRCFVPSVYAGRPGRKYFDARSAAVSSIAPTRSQGIIEEALDVRHPFLYRPLVEFALGLPPDLCVRPQARKWILREAMLGILPDSVRTRVGKGSVYGLIAWSLGERQQLLEPLVQDPILAQLGVIDGRKLRASFAEAQHERNNRQRLASAITNVLAIEAWLQLRSSRWPRGAMAA